MTAKRLPYITRAAASPQGDRLINYDEQDREPSEPEPIWRLARRAESPYDSNKAPKYTTRLSERSEAEQAEQTARSSTRRRQEKRQAGDVNHPEYWQWKKGLGEMFAFLLMTLFLVLMAAVCLNALNQAPGFFRREKAISRCMELMPPVDTFSELGEQRRQCKQMLQKLERKPQAQTPPLDPWRHPARE